MTEQQNPNAVDVTDDDVAAAKEAQAATTPKRAKDTDPDRGSAKKTTAKKA